MNHVLPIIAGTALAVIGAELAVAIEEAECEVIKPDKEFGVRDYATPGVELTIWKKF